MKQVKEFRTTQCQVSVYETGFVYEDQKIYCIKSLHRKTGKENIRFGTIDQINQIIRTYKQVRVGGFIL